MKEHFLQSPIWGKYENLEGHQTFRIKSENFSAMAILKHTPFGKYLFCPYGPTIQGKNFIDYKNNFVDALCSLIKLAQEQNAFFVRIEPPFNVLRGVDFGKTFRLIKSHDIDPATTWVLDLARSEEKILADIEKEKVRLWRNCHKKGITVRQTKNPTEIDPLILMLKQVGVQNHFIPQGCSHLVNQMRTGFATLYIAELWKKPIACALFYDFDGVRYYAHAAANYEYRKFSAGAVLLIQSIIDAKRMGARSFDFWGITTSNRRRHPWYGFTQFKKSFGGEQINYAGTWDLPIKKTKYRFYCLVRKINRIRRKIYHHK